MGGPFVSPNLEQPKFSVAPDVLDIMRWSKDKMSIRGSLE